MNEQCKEYEQEHQIFLSLNLNHNCSQISIESESQNVMSFKSEFHVLCILFQAKAKDPDARPRPH